MASIMRNHDPMYTEHRFSRAEKFSTYECVYDPEHIEDVSAFFDFIAELLRDSTPSEYFSRELNLDYISKALEEKEDRKIEIYNFVKAHRANSHLNYHSVETFVRYDQTYFYLNLYKCLIACSFLRKEIARGEINPSTETIVDVGSGVGTFTLAAALSIPRVFKNFHLLDEAPLQLDLAKRLLRLFGVVKFSTHLGTAQNFHHLRGMRVASYWLCGDDRVLNTPASTLLSPLMRDGLIIMDYSERLMEFYNHTKDFIEQNSGGVYAVNITCRLPKYHSRILLKEYISVHMLVIGSS